MYKSREEKLLDYERNLADNWKEALHKGEVIGVLKGEVIGVQTGEVIGIQKGEVIGIQKGEARGFLHGQVVALESVLGMSPTPMSELMRLSLEELQSRVQQLQTQIPTRNGFKSES